MSTAFWIWLYLVVGDLAEGGGYAALFVIFIARSCLIAAAGEAPNTKQAREDAEKKFLLWCKKVFVSLCCLLCLSLFYPSKNDLALIFGGSLALDLAKTDEAQKIPENTLKAINTFLEAVAEDGGPSDE